MYQIIIIVRYICIAAILLELLICLHRKPSRLQSIMFFVLINCLIISLGSLFELTSASLKTALIAHKCIHFGEIILLSAIFLFVQNYCNIKHTKYFTFILVFLDFLLLAGLTTCEKHPFYYTHVRFVHQGLYPHLETTPGILTILFQMISLFFILFIPVICLYQARKCTYEAIRNSLFHLFLLFLLPFAGTIYNTILFLITGERISPPRAIWVHPLFIANVSYTNYVIFTICSMVLLFRHNWFVINQPGSIKVVKNLEQEVRFQTKQLEKTQHAMMSCFADMIEARDGITGLHVKRTSAYVSIITHELAHRKLYSDILTDEYMEDVINSAPLHDIGKISIPDSILKKPSRLTKEEFAIIQKHPESGAKMIDEIIKQVDGDTHLAVARDMVLYHHEKWDGTGYPYKLHGNEIPLSARIMAISDVYEALISKRSYKEGYPIEKAISIIKEGRGTYFDPQLVDVFVDVFDQIMAIE